MYIFIPIPIGTRRVAAVEGEVWKSVSCARCGQDYAYRLELRATGEDFDVMSFLDAEESSQRALARAEQNLAEQSRNIVLPVPCPHCGFYQEDMSRNLRGDASINLLQIAGAAIVVLGLVPLAFDIPHIWIATVVLAAVGLAILAYGYWIAFAFDPNAGDPEPRRLLGRQKAVWGERLAELRAASRQAEWSSTTESSREAPKGT
jgi:hypothetical protein